MARRLRYHLQGGTYHVMLRGNDGQDIFFSDKDRCKMCLLIQEGVERFGHQVLAFCFMSNHVHLAIQVDNIDLSRIIQNLSFRYTRYINWNRKRIGHLFQGRFKSILVDSGRYLKELIRYIHLNPVRAGLVIRPEDYRWSSHNTYLGVSDLVWLATDKLLSRFGDSFQTAVSDYERFIHYAKNNLHEVDFKRGTCEGILGDEGFVKMVNEKAESLYEINFSVMNLVNIVCEFYNLDIDSLKRPGKERCLSHVRAVLALLVQDNSSLTLEELSQIVERDASSLSKHAARLKIKSLTSEELKTEIKKIKTYILEMPECQA